jgi:glycerol uptake facilitator-like aquaporin
MTPPPRIYLAEFAGTFAWVFLSAGAVLADSAAKTLEQPPIGPVGIALAVGLSYAGLLAATVPLAGGFLNPAVVLALWVFHRLDSGRALALILVQFAGAAVAGLAVRAIVAVREDALIAARLGTPHLNVEAFGASRIGPAVLLQGMGLEAVVTFAIVLVILATYFDPRTARLLDGFARRWANVAVGLLTTAVVLVAGQLTGAATNPARWFGTVIWEPTVPVLAARNPLADHAVYWVGPTVGALAAAMLYHYLILPKQLRQQPVD